jgi:23S rRNA (guanosine2251-2'-O)-methyltransferase
MTERAPIGGIHSVRAALKFGTEGVDEVWLERARRDRRLQELADLAREAGIRLRQVERSELERAAAGVNHQGALAWVRVPSSLYRIRPDGAARST